MGLLHEMFPYERVPSLSGRGHFFINNIGGVVAVVGLVVSVLTVLSLGVGVVVWIPVNLIYFLVMTVSFLYYWIYMFSKYPMDACWKASRGRCFVMRPCWYGSVKTVNSWSMNAFYSFLIGWCLLWALIGYVVIMWAFLLHTMVLVFSVFLAVSRGKTTATSPEPDEPV